MISAADFEEVLGLSPQQLAHCQSLAPVSRPLEVQPGSGGERDEPSRVDQRAISERSGELTLPAPCQPRHPQPGLVALDEVLAAGR